MIDEVHRRTQKISVLIPALATTAGGRIGGIGDIMK